MGSVGLKDQLLQSHLVERKETNKRYMKLFQSLLHSTVLNALRRIVIPTLLGSASTGSLPKVQNCKRFQVLTAASMKFRVFWDVAPCRHVEVDRRFRVACPDDGGSTYLCNISQLQHDYTTLHPRRLNFIQNCS
jgi:hypothetical protein